VWLLACASHPRNVDDLQQHSVYADYDICVGWGCHNSARAQDVYQLLAHPHPQTAPPACPAFCIAAVTHMHPHALPHFCVQKGIQVINSARQGSASGTVVGSTGSGASSSSSGRTGANMALIAFPETQLLANGSSSPTGASKLRVGPAFLAGQFQAGKRDIFGPYWVVAVGEWR
jgi:hypothetical protein